MWRGLHLGVQQSLALLLVFLLTGVFEINRFLYQGAIKVSDLGLEPGARRDPGTVDGCYSFLNTDMHPIPSEHLLERVEEVLEFSF